jgi:hypothetical protein
MVLASVGLGFGLSIMNQSKEKLSWAMSLSIVSTYTYVGMHAIGLGPATWVYSSEIFPLKLRAQGASIGVAVNRGMNARQFTKRLQLVTWCDIFYVCWYLYVGWGIHLFILARDKREVLGRDGDALQQEG